MVSIKVKTLSFTLGWKVKRNQGAVISPTFKVTHEHENATNAHCLPKTIPQLPTRRQRIKTKY